VSAEAAAVAEPQVVPVEEAAKPKDDKRPKKQPRYHVILWNDDDHTFEYVITMLQELFGHPVEKGYQLAKEVDVNGRAIVLTTTMEHAELKRDQIKAYGKDVLIAKCAGSMSASIEAAPE
jgi:ATP-dependent Clp protease adaptor protein ClpS